MLARQKEWECPFFERLVWKDFGLGSDVLELTSAGGEDRETPRCS